mmetsp:Transcript_15153/g.33888  ORF Transcript_15153/g.33888 Transcript_15153/m.33888 type:complete len:92 (-) Transcript_15153:1620-1895(-)
MAWTFRWAKMTKRMTIRTVEENESDEDSEDNEDYGNGGNNDNNDPNNDDIDVDDKDVDGGEVVMTGMDLKPIRLFVYSNASPRPVPPPTYS